MENIRISNAILSRFDLVFLMLDDPDLMRDKKLSEHVMKLHSRNRKRKYDDFSSQPNTEHAHEIQSMDLPTSQGSAKRAKTNDFGSE
jgi:DNA helicase MCM8